MARIVSVKVQKTLSFELGKDRFVDEIGAGPATFVVEKVYKGNLRVNGEIVAGTAPNSACGWSFLDKWVGQRFLLYLIGDGSDDSWDASTCGRTTAVEYATEDLLYLDNMEKLRGKTRVSGDYRGGSVATLENIANRTIRLTGETGTYETKTDANGVYEIYDLPPGKYVLEPEIPNGWKIARHSVLNPEFGPVTKLKFILDANKHVTMDLAFDPSNIVEGNVVGPDGNPMRSVCVSLQKPDQVQKDIHSDCTNSSGEFRIHLVPAGVYVAVLNPDGKLSPEEPFPTTFYPSVTQREKAALITIGNGETVKGINFVVTKLVDMVTVSGILLFSDGKPAAEELVTFAPLNQDAYDRDHSVRTDSEGRFTVQILKGFKGEIFGEFEASLGEYAKCPKLDALIKESVNEDEDYAEIKSPAIKVDAERNTDNLLLQFPFPKCKKKE